MKSFLQHRVSHYKEIVVLYCKHLFAAYKSDNNCFLETVLHNGTMSLEKKSLVVSQKWDMLYGMC